MNVEEFRHQARTTLEQTLNHLQTATLLIAELDTQISAAGHSIQSLSQMIEAFTEQQARVQGAIADAPPSNPPLPESNDDV